MSVDCVEATKPFDPADVGTSEEEWRASLRHCSDWTPRQGPLIVVAPHPDDEVLGAGGLIHAWASAGQDVTVVSVTDGEAADTRRPHLDLVRRTELRNALRRLSLVHVSVKRLGIPDGQVGEHKNRLRSALTECAREGVTLIAPYERDGHPDHEAVGDVCLEVARCEEAPIARYPVWTWHHTKPENLQTLQWGLFRLDASAQRAKTRALQCFESQLRPPRGQPIVPPHVLAHFERPYEAFVL